MRRFLVAVLFVAAVWPLPAQSLPSADTILDLIISRYGGSAPQAANAQLSGTIQYANGTSKPFSLTVSRQSSRFEVGNPEELSTIVREEQRVQTIRTTKKGPRRGFIDRWPLSFSEMNLAPILALLNFKSDARYAGTLASAADGSIGLKFTEGPPPGYNESPFAQVRAIVTFWLDGNYQIRSIDYSDSRNFLSPSSYRYSNTEALTTPFLQTRRVEYRVRDTLAWTAEVSVARVNVTVPADFFQLSQ